MVTFDDSEMRKLTADLQQAGARVGKEVADIVRKHGKALQAKAEQLSPKPPGKSRRATGKLASSWEPHGWGDGRSGDMSAGIRNTTRQAFFQEHGTSKHPPQPSGGPALEAITPAFIADMEKAAGEVLD